MYFTYTLFTPLILTADQKNNVAQLTGSYYYLLNFSETFTSVCSNANLYLGSARLSEKNVGASWPLSFHFWSPEQAF